MKLTEMGFKKEKTKFYLMFEKKIKVYGNIVEIMIAYSFESKTIQFHLKMNDQEIVWKVISKEILDGLYEELEEL